MTSLGETSSGMRKIDITKKRKERNSGVQTGGRDRQNTAAKGY
jgi:hypothetical protein